MEPNDGSRLTTCLHWLNTTPDYQTNKSFHCSQHTGSQPGVGYASTQVGLSLGGCHPRHTHRLHLSASVPIKALQAWWQAELIPPKTCFPPESLLVWLHSRAEFPNNCPMFSRLRRSVSGGGGDRTWWRILLRWVPLFHRRLDGFLDSTPYQWACSAWFLSKCLWESTSSCIPLRSTAPKHNPACR
jgi:hypothetical protein